MTIKHLKTEKNTAQVTIIASSTEIAAAINLALKKLSQELSVRGFRKGNVPPGVAEKEIGQEKLTQQAVDQILEQGLLQIIKAGKYNLIGQPQLEDADIKTKTSWTFTLSLPLQPKIDLTGYKKTAKAALQKTKDKTKDQQLNAIIDSLLKKIDIQVPPILIDREVDYSLSRLVKQIEAVNLEMTAYLKSINKTPKSIRQEYAQKGEESLKLDLLLSQIAQDLKIKVSQEEIKEFALASQIPSERQNSLVPILARRKALDQLLTL